MNLAEKIATLYRTLDWMDANPDKTIVGVLARDTKGNACRPQREGADCFCFIGRLCVEAGLDERLYTNTALERWFEDLELTPGTLTYINDMYEDAERRLPMLRSAIDHQVAMIA